jgi:hypothetical protein
MDLRATSSDIPFDLAVLSQDIFWNLTKTSVITRMVGSKSFLRRRRSRQAGGLDGKLSSSWHGLMLSMEAIGWTRDPVARFGLRS